MVKNLVKVSTFAKSKGWTTTYIYQLIEDKRIVSVIIDGMIFIDISKPIKNK